MFMNKLYHFSLIAIGSGGSGGSGGTDANSSRNITCSEGFYLDGEVMLCFPECGVWRLYPSTLDTAVMILTIVLTAVGILSGMFVLINACFRRKTM